LGSKPNTSIIRAVYGTCYASTRLSATQANRRRCEHWQQAARLQVSETVIAPALPPDPINGTQVTISGPK